MQRIILKAETTAKNIYTDGQYGVNNNLISAGGKKSSARSKATRMLFLSTFILIFFLLMANTQEAKALTHPPKTYTVRVTYYDCKCGKSDCSEKSRGEVWSDEFDIVYVEITTCNGTTTTIGPKPMVPPGTNGRKILDSVAAIQDDRTFAEALATALPPTSYSQGESYDTTYFGVITHRIWKNYEFEFPDWYYLPEGYFANVNALSSGNDLFVNTDIQIYAKVIDLQTGNILYPNTLITSSHNFNISSFATGCKYAIIISQEINNVLYENIETISFCK